MKTTRKQRTDTKSKHFLVKVTVPRIITDNPMCTFTSKDGQWVQEVPINQQIVRWLGGKHEAYFEITMNSFKISSMKPVTEELYYAEGQSSGEQ